jgi:hypothetical protein
MDRASVELDGDGQIVVDTSRFAPDSYIAVPQ